MRLLHIAHGHIAICILIAALLCLLAGCQTSAAERVRTGATTQPTWIPGEIQHWEVR